MSWKLDNQTLSKLKFHRRQNKKFPCEILNFLDERHFIKYDDIWWHFMTYGDFSWQNLVVYHGISKCHKECVYTIILSP